jgi:serine/threonine protein kinase
MGFRAPTTPERAGAIRLAPVDPTAGSFARGSSATRLPEQFGKYSILGHLATGGMAEVYVARQTGMHGFQKTVVLKRVRPELNDGETVASFLDEARLVADLEHSNIAQVYEVGEVGESYFFVMEYVNGADLRQVMERAVTSGVRISLGDTLFIIVAVCAALHYAHERCDFDGQSLSIVHRDVSPSNVLISHDGAVKVCDFGIAKARNRSTETVRGTIKGKFAYMSPEQCRCQPLDRRSDIFSIGLLLYELSTLSRAFSASNEFDLLRSIIEHPVERPTTRVGDYPPELERIVLRALEKDPDKRYATAQEMQSDLEAFALEHKLAMSPINVSSLMDTLFDRRIDGWARAQHGVRARSEPLPDLVVTTTAPPTAELEIELDMATSVRVPAPAPQTRRRADAPWLVAALVGASIAGGATVAEHAAAPAAPDASLFDGDARAISAALETAVHTAQLRVDGTAATPMLRAAIETDAATIADLAHDGKLIAPAQREVVEIFQNRDGRSSSMLRVPADAPAIEVRANRETRVETDGTQLLVIAAAPIPNSHSGTGGTFAMSVPVDLEPIQKLLQGRVETASLAGLGREVRLVGPPRPLLGAALRVPVPRDPSSPPLALVVGTVPVDDNPWWARIWYAGISLVLAALAGFAFTRIRARASTHAC